MPEQSAPIAMTVVFHGRVQGVWFRGFTLRNARELGVSGWVRNRRDGTVEALFTGTDRDVTELLARCTKGPPAARVSKVITTPCPMPSGPLAGFSQRETV